MSEPMHFETVDLSDVQDPDARRALRALQQQFTERFKRQQLEIDALLEVILEKHLTSFGELKHTILRLQQNTLRTSRLHEVLEASTPAPHPTA